MKKLALLLLLLLVLSTAVSALSSDEAIALVSVKNNYLLTGESATTTKDPITYQGSQYLVVATMSGDAVTCYIPIRSSDSKIATLDLEIREIIKTTIAYSKMTELKNNTTPADWPFSYSTKNFFYDLSNDFTSLANDILSTQTILNGIGTTEAKTLALQVGLAKNAAEDLSDKSKTLSTQIETSRLYEESYLSGPDTNKTNKYETNYKNFFTSVADFKQEFVDLQTTITEINQGVSTLDPSKLTTDQQKTYQILLTKVPIAISKGTRTNPGKLDSFFSTTDQLRTMIEGVFNSSRNSEGYATTLDARKVRSDAWIKLYGTNETMTKLDPSFTTLQKAATAVLSTENVDYWKDQDSVEALKVNWNGAEQRYNNSEYTKAKEYALKAEKNVTSIMSQGLKQTESPINQDLIIKIVGGLVILLIGLFIFEKYKAKKKNKEDEYNEA
ncbi:MAG: hypothetical protein WCW44_02485 [archaeon]